MSKRYTNQELLKYIRKFYKENGRAPMAKEFNDNPNYPSFGTYITRFGSWNGTIIECGLKPNNRILGGGLKYTDKELLECLKQFFDENDRAPTVRDFINNLEYPSTTVYTKRFGSWDKALKSVELDTDSMIRKGFLENSNQRSRLFELQIKEYLGNKVIDLSGQNHSNTFDGIYKGEIYEVKYSTLMRGRFYQYLLDKCVDNYYLGAFNKDFENLKHVWKIPGDFRDGLLGFLYVGVDNKYEHNIINMRKYEFNLKGDG